MSTIGPTLPPHLASKRKRSESTSSGEGPAPPPAQRPKSGSPPSTKSLSKVAGPTLPPLDRGDISSTTSPDTSPKVIGPSLPPPHVDELLPSAENAKSGQGLGAVEDSSDEDDLGPPLPPPTGLASSAPSWGEVQQPEELVPTASKPLQREDWMLAPPSGADWAQRIDPTKLKSRKFNTMKGAKAPHNAERGASGVGGLWTETPEEKRKRLEDEVMGAKSLGPSDKDDKAANMSQRRNPEEDRETERKVREYNKTHRGSTSLLELHRVRSRKDGKEDDDDPSKRAFDREKDIAGGAFSSMQRREVLNRAKNMDSRFEKARYL